MDGTENTSPAPPLRPADTTSEAFRAWRDGLWDQHPVVIWNQEFLLPTPALADVSESVARDIYYCRSGTAFVGDTRFGKSSAIRYLIARVKETFPQVGIIQIDADFRTRPTDTGFYGDLLSAAEFPLKKGRTASDRRQQAEALCVSMGRNGDKRRLILFVDEAQNWGEAEWTWLKTIQTYLARHLIAMVVVAFGQDQLNHRRSAFEQSGRRDLTKRFLRRLYPFHGIATAQGLRKIFALFDTTCFPVVGGVPFSEFFFPLAFHAGWRFANETDRCLGVFLGHAGTREIGMECIALACKFFLTEYSREDRADWLGDADHWRRAVDFSDWRDDDGIE